MNMPSFEINNLDIPTLINQKTKVTRTIYLNYYKKVIQ